MTHKSHDDSHRSIVTKKFKAEWIKDKCSTCLFYTDRDYTWDFETCYSACSVVPTIGTLGVDYGDKK